MILAILVHHGLLGNIVIVHEDELPLSLFWSSSGHLASRQKTVLTYGIL